MRICCMADGDDSNLSEKLTRCEFRGADAGFCANWTCRMPTKWMLVDGTTLASGEYGSLRATTIREEEFHRRIDRDRIATTKPVAQVLHVAVLAFFAAT